MADSYKPSRAFRLHTEEALPPGIPMTVVEHDFNSINFRDGDSSSTFDPAEHTLQAPRLPARLMIALTCGLGGLQLVWSILFSHGSAYLFSLGITNSQSSLIWAIAPICGAIVQPIVGAISDKSQSRWGQRRPFILGGAIGVIVSLTALAWQYMRGLAAVFGIHSHASVKTTIQIGTIICITLLNIAIQPLQSGLRALIVDVCPPEQQSIASAWAGRFAGISNILGYMLGSLPLHSTSHGNEASRFRFLTLLSAAALTATALTTSYFIREEKPTALAREPSAEQLLPGALRNAKDGWRSMPLQSRRVCLVQFFAWMGWFGFLFYSTSYVDRLYLFESRRRGIEHYLDRPSDTGIRLGTFASLLSAVTALVTTVIAPHVVSTTSGVSRVEKSRFKGWLAGWRQMHIVWAVSHLLFALCAFCTVFVSSTNMAIAVIATTGVSWGIAQWAPFALLGEEIALRQVERNSASEMGVWQGVSSQSGAMMGVHNAAISVPQILAALGSSFIFWMFEGDGLGENGGIAWVLRASGVAALVAAYFAWRLK